MSKAKKKPTPAPTAAAGVRLATTEPVQKELNKLQATLLKIKSNGRDDKGPLDPAQRAQIDAAIKEIGVARALLDCIQDQAPYGLNPKP